jgi:hypothetical protein
MSRAAWEDWLAAREGSTGLSSGAPEDEFDDVDVEVAHQSISKDVEFGDPTTGPNGERDGGIEVHEDKVGEGRGEEEPVAYVADLRASSGILVVSAIASKGKESGQRPLGQQEGGEEADWRPGAGHVDGGRWANALADARHAVGVRRSRLSWLPIDCLTRILGLCAVFDAKLLHVRLSCRALNDIATRFWPLIAREAVLAFMGPVAVAASLAGSGLPHDASGLLAEEESDDEELMSWRRIRDERRSAAGHLRDVDEASLPETERLHRVLDMLVSEAAVAAGDDGANAGATAADSLAQGPDRRLSILAEMFPLVPVHTVRRVLASWTQAGVVDELLRIQSEELQAATAASGDEDGVVTGDANDADWEVLWQRLGCYGLGTWTAVDSWVVTTGRRFRAAPEVIVSPTPHHVAVMVLDSVMLWRERHGAWPGVPTDVRWDIALGDDILLVPSLVTVQDSPFLLACRGNAELLLMDLDGKTAARLELGDNSGHGRSLVAAALRLEKFASPSGAVARRVLVVVVNDNLPGTCCWLELFTLDGREPPFETARIDRRQVSQRRARQCDLSFADSVFVEVCETHRQFDWRRQSHVTVFTDAIVKVEMGRSKGTFRRLGRAATIAHVDGGMLKLFPNFAPNGKAVFARWEQFHGSVHICEEARSQQSPGVLHTVQCRSVSSAPLLAAATLGRSWMLVGQGIAVACCNDGARSYRFCSELPFSEDVRQAPAAMSACRCARGTPPSLAAVAVSTRRAVVIHDKRGSSSQSQDSMQASAAMDSGTGGTLWSMAGHGTGLTVFSASGEGKVSVWRRSLQ